MAKNTMTEPIAKMASSKHSGLVEVRGFDSTDQSAHMFEWLGKGKDVARLVVDDVESELDAQDKGSKLISVSCVKPPDLRTKAIVNDSGSKQGILKEFAATLPLEMSVESSRGERWRLAVEYTYELTGMHDPANRKLRLDFKVLSAQPEPK
jgi:hypothetical protein